MAAGDNRDANVSEAPERPQRPVVERHTIEVAKTGRSSCQSCEKPIGAGELRLAEAFVNHHGGWARSHQRARSYRPRETDDDRRYDDEPRPDVTARFHHLLCAATKQPYLLQSALAGATMPIPNRAELERAIEQALSAVDVAEEDATTRAEYGGFIERMRGAGDGDDTVLVFADWLQSVGDPRGALIVAQTQMERASFDERVQLSDVEKKLWAANRARFFPDRLEGTPTWRRGFIHRLTITTTTGIEPTTLGRAFGHPSFRLLRELAVELPSPKVVTVNLPSPLPPTLRTIELGCANEDWLGDARALLDGGLPQLRHLVLRGAADIEDLAHPTLAALELASADAGAPHAAMPRRPARTLADRIGGLGRASLPSLRSVILRVAQRLDLVVAKLGGIVDGLDTMVLAGDLTDAGAARLLAALEKRSAGLATLDLSGCPRLSPRVVDGLKPLVTSLLLEVAPPAVEKAAPAPAGDWLVRHTRRPEWGIGRVIEEGDDGLQVEFENAGAKLVRNVELLEDVAP